MTNVNVLQIHAYADVFPWDQEAYEQIRDDMKASGYIGAPEIVVPAVGFVRNVWSDRTPEPEWFGDIPQWGLPGPNADTMVGSWAKWRDGRVVEANRGESG